MTACAYCKRELDPPGSYSLLRPTDDHVVPQSRGGREVVRACYQCNHIKADMLPDEWDAFMAANPQWWRSHYRQPPKPDCSPRFDPEKIDFRDNAPMTTHGTAAQQIMRKWFPEWKL